MTTALNEHETGQKFFVNIEGTEYPWPKDTITTAEIRVLGNLPGNLPIVEEYPNGTERTLGESETIKLKPGHRFGAASRYKRG